MINYQCTEHLLIFVITNEFLWNYKQNFESNSYKIIWQNNNLEEGIYEYINKILCVLITFSFFTQNGNIKILFLFIFFHLFWFYRLDQSYFMQVISFCQRNGLVYQLKCFPQQEKVLFQGFFVMEYWFHFGKTFRGIHYLKNKNITWQLHKTFFFFFSSLKILRLRNLLGKNKTKTKRYLRELIFIDPKHKVNFTEVSKTDFTK